MKKRLLAGLLALGAMSAIASEYQPYFPLGNGVDRFVGADGSGHIFVNGSVNEFGRFESRGFRIIDSTVDVNFHEILDPADAKIKSLLGISDSEYVNGFFENYPDLPDNPERFSQFDINEAITAADYLPLANSLLKLVEAEIKSNNIVFQTSEYYSVLEVRGNTVVITNGSAGNSGDKLYSCALDDLLAGVDFRTTLDSCVSAPYTYASNGATNFVPGYYAPITDSGLLFARSRPADGESDVKKVSVISQENGVHESQDLNVTIGDYHIDMTSSVDNSNYIYINSGAGGLSTIIKYSGENFSVLDAQENVGFFGLEPFYEYDIYGSSKDHVVFVERIDQNILNLYQCRLVEKNTRDILYEDYISYLSTPESSAGILLSQYPKKPENYNEIVVELEIEHEFPQNITDEEFQEIVDGLLSPGHSELVASESDVLGCAKGSKKIIDKRAGPVFLSNDSGNGLLVYNKFINNVDDPSAIKLPVLVALDLSSGEKKYISKEILMSVGVNDPLLQKSISLVLEAYPWLDIDNIVMPENLTDLGLSPDLTQEEFKAHIYNLILGHQPFGNRGVLEPLNRFQTPFSAEYFDGVLYTNIGSIRLSSASSSGVKVSVKPENNTIDPYLNAVSSVEIITDGELFAADVNCAVVGPMAVTSADYGSWGGTERLTLPLQWDNKNTHGVVSLKGDVAPVTDEQQLLVLDTLAEMTTADVTVNCQATVSDQAGKPLSVTVVPATIRIDDGIHGGSGVITGQVDLPAGVTPQDVTVQVTINGRTIDVTVDENGSFQFDGLRDGEFVVNVVSDRYTQSCINTQTTGSVNDLGVIELIAGDINSDGEINIADFTFLAGRYGSLKGDDNYSALADLNSDEQINVQDLAILGNHFGSRQCSL